MVIEASKPGHYIQAFPTNYLCNDFGGVCTRMGSKGFKAILYRVTKTLMQAPFLAGSVGIWEFVQAVLALTSGNLDQLSTCRASHNYFEIYDIDGLTKILQC